MTPNNTILLFTISGIGIVIGGLYFNTYILPNIIQEQLHQKLQLSNGSETYPMWQKLPFPLSFNIYIFNVTNPHEVHNGARPILNEIGPFCYDLYREKIVIDVSENGNFITYDSRRLYFERTGPNCVSTQLQMTILNFALLGTIHVMLELLPDFLPTFDETIPLMYPGIETIFITAKVVDILFNGLLLNCSNPDSTLGLVCRNVESMSPPQIRRHPNGKDFLFAALYYMNNTSEGIFRLDSGKTNLSNVGNINQLNGGDHLNYWLSPQCNAIMGTDGYVNPPVDGQTQLIFFQMDLCRSIALDFIEETEIYDIPVRKYGATPRTLAASDANKCYCSIFMDVETETNVTKCLEDGVINLKACFKAPVILSWPHFYMASETYQRYPTGLKPERVRHENNAYIQPLTGVPLRGSKRAQINMFLIQSDDVTVLNNVSEGLFPVFWIDEGAEIPEDIRKMLTSNILLLKIVGIIKPLIVAIGVGSILYAVFLYTRQRQMFCFGANNQVENMTSSNNDNRGLVHPRQLSREFSPPNFQQTTTSEWSDAFQNYLNRRQRYEQ